ncbi:hypothetical protein RR48_03778 [Papilio machaon]|uniref:Uncharacterized protein n=1 Tax=Papilio machaon TaxID=76193 RepID=A0A0N1II67_PAPMA|nr:hypothetical protein RR48_03778 [Papilio machaon]
MGRFMFIITFMYIYKSVWCSLDVSLVNDGPAVRGSNITFTARVKGYGGENLKYVFCDDVQPQHEQEFQLSTNESKWTVEYPKELYEAGEYVMRVKLMKSFYGIWYFVTSARSTFRLTDSLNGNLVLNQDNLERPNNFVAVNKTVLHYIKLPDNEMEYLKNNASTIITYWFIDCIYIDQTTDLSLNYTYNDLMADHYIDALVVANNLPLPPVTTTTTTTTTTTQLLLQQQQQQQQQHLNHHQQQQIIQH